MQPREYVQAACRFEETDLVPYRIDFEADLEFRDLAVFDATEIAVELR